MNLGTSKLYKHSLLLLITTVFMFTACSEKTIVQYKEKIKKEPKLETKLIEKKLRLKSQLKKLLPKE